MSFQTSGDGSLHVPILRLPKYLLDFIWIWSYDGRILLSILSGADSAASNLELPTNAERGVVLLICGLDFDTQILVLTADGARTAAGQ